jgi:ribosomal protein S18 acetylase RimI-like enzyme
MLNIVNRSSWLEIDEFNSRIFGILMANISQDYTGDGDEIVALAHEEGIKHLTYKLETDKYSRLKCFLTNGFSIVDTQVTYKLHNCKFINTMSNPNIEIRNSLFDDLATLTQIAKESFNFGRFHNDNSLEKDRVKQYYQEWVKNCFYDEEVEMYTVLSNNHVCGFSSWKYVKESGSLRLVLTAIDSDYRNQGLYTYLISQNLTYFFSRYKIDCAIMGTQLSNKPVHKVWGKLGAYIFESKHVLHKFNEVK